MKFTTEQQKKIAKYAIDHDNDFKATGEKNDISYQQVAAWVRKYREELVNDSSAKSANKKTTNKKAATKKTTSKKSTTTKTDSKKAVSTKTSSMTKSAVTKSKPQPQPVENAANTEDTTSTLDVLSRRDPVLEKQLEDVKRRLGLI